MLTIKEIGLDNVMGHASTVLFLPDRGVVLVTGPNGSGKSSIPETVATAYWGASLRGDKGWGELDDQRVHVLAKHAGTPMQVYRSKKTAKAPVSLTWGKTTYQTASKGDEEIVKAIGDFDTWRRSCVISSDDHKTFTRSTAGDRQRMIEALLDLERFDDASTRCRAELRECSDDVAEWSATVRRHEHSLASVEAKIAEACRACDDIDRGREVVDLDALDAQVAEHDRTLVQLQEERASLALDIELAKRPEPHPYEKRFDLIRSGRCPTCEQTVDEGRISQLETEITEHRTRRQEADRKALQSRSRLNAVIQDIANINARRVSLIRQRAETVAAEKSRAAEKERLDSWIVKWGRERDSIAAEADDARASVAAAERRVEILTACDKVLGLQGVRSHILARSLSVIEQSANAWTRRLGNIAMRIDARTPKKGKRGAYTDKIHFQVHHSRRGTWHDFAALSSGEKRRVDVAMLFALSEISCAIRGVSRGTLFCDEIDVNLDDEGVAMLAEVLEEFALNRCVVVISPNERLRDHLTPAEHWRVDRGVVTCA